MADQTFTKQQLAIAARELREAAGADDATFSKAQAISMLSEEIRLLRERGFTDAQIADLLTGFDIPVSADDIGKNTPPPQLAQLND